MKKFDFFSSVSSSGGAEVIRALWNFFLRLCSYNSHLCISARSEQSLINSSSNVSSNFCEKPRNIPANRTRWVKESLIICKTPANIPENKLTLCSSRDASKKVVLLNSPLRSHFCAYTLNCNKLRNNNEEATVDSVDEPRLSFFHQSPLFSLKNHLISTKAFVRCR